MNNSNCVLCGAISSEPLSVADAKNGDFLPIVRCKQCGLVQQMPMPSTDELEIYYSHNYRAEYKAVYEPEPKYVHRAGCVALERLAWIQNICSPSLKTHLLDIGAGGGEFVYCAKLRGFNARGIEPNVGYSEFARQHYGIDIETIMLPQLEKNSCNIITMFHVLEHLSDPRSVVIKLAEALSDDGLAIIEVPNILQLDASPANIFFKAHLTYYSEQTLRALFSSHFEEVFSDAKGNLKFIFRKKIKRGKIKFPSSSEVEYERNRFAQKSWFSYLFKGKGCLKFFKNISRRLRERKYEHAEARQILDDLVDPSAER